MKNLQDCSSGIDGFYAAATALGFLGAYRIYSTYIRTLRRRPMLGVHSSNLRFRAQGCLCGGRCFPKSGCIA